MVIMLLRRLVQIFGFWDSWGFCRVYIYHKFIVIKFGGSVKRCVIHTNYNVHVSFLTPAPRSMK